MLEVLNICKIVPNFWDMSQKNVDPPSSNEQSSLPIGLDTSTVLLTTRNASTKSAEISQEQLEECNFDILTFAATEKSNDEIQDRLSPILSSVLDCIPADDDDEFSESSAIFEVDSFIKRMLSFNSLVA